MLGHSDAELSSLGGYDLVHFDDLAYVASAHQERKFGHRLCCSRWPGNNPKII